MCLSPAAPPPPSLVTLQCVEWATVLCGFALCVDCDQELLLISVPPPVAALHHHCYHRAWNVGIVYVPELTCTVRGVFCAVLLPVCLSVSPTPHSRTSVLMCVEWVAVLIVCPCLHHHTRTSVLMCVEWVAVLPVYPCLHHHHHHHHTTISNMLLLLCVECVMATPEEF